VATGVRETHGARPRQIQPRSYLLQLLAREQCSTRKTVRPQEPVLPPNDPQLPLTTATMPLVSHLTVGPYALSQLPTVGIFIALGPDAREMLPSSAGSDLSGFLG
jgi:hypothetical protein